MPNPAHTRPARRWSVHTILPTVLAAAISCVALAVAAADGAEAGADAATSDEPPTRSKAEVEKLIETAGSTHPDWWDDVPLVVPQGLDLTYEAPKGGRWQPRKYIGQYVVTVLRPHPDRWRGGIRLLHHAAEVNKDHPERRRKSLQHLGRAYFEWEHDWARAAYYWSQAGTNGIEVAECYWRLGCKPLGIQTLRRFPRDLTREATVIKLWGEFGDLRRALSLAQAKARIGHADVAYLAAGNACRLHGKFDQAARFYQEVAKVSKGTRDLGRNKMRAQRNLDALVAFANVDVSKIADGTYRSSSRGYRGDVDVEVTVEGGKITDCKVSRHKDDWCARAPMVVPERIVRKQGIAGVDAITGATISSEAILNAAAQALADGAKGK